MLLGITILLSSRNLRADLPCKECAPGAVVGAESVAIWAAAAKDAHLICPCCRKLAAPDREKRGPVDVPQEVAGFAFNKMATHREKLGARLQYPGPDRAIK